MTVRNPMQRKPDQRAIELPWQEPTLGEQGDAPTDTRARLTYDADAATLSLEDRAARSAERAEWASRQAINASNEIAGALTRLLETRGVGGGAHVGIEEETPNDIEIRVGEAAHGPLMRAADAVARTIAAAGGTIHDYSGGHYGLEPVRAEDLRRERKREKRSAHPVAIIEGHYTGDRALAREKKGSRIPLLLVLAFGVAAVGVAYAQRGRLRPLLDRVVEQLRGRNTSMPEPKVLDVSSDAPTPTPSFNRVVSGQLIEATPPAAASASAPRASTTSAAASAGVAESTDSSSHTFTAGDQK